MKIKIKKTLKEMSVMGGGAVAGHVDNRKKEELEEISQSSGLTGHNIFPKASAEEEHESHVERSQHQGLKNVTESKKIKIKIKKNLKERCQKGYKTHATRKTKKMFGKTYRNCVKAEGQLDEKELTKAEYKKKKEIAKALEKDNPNMPDDKKYAIATATAKRVAEKKDPKAGTGKKPKGSGRRLYTDEDPSDTVSVKFSTVQDIKDTFSKASFKSKSHKRQSQIINLVHQRVRAAYQNAKDPKVKKRLKKAYDYAKQRKEASKKKTQRMKKTKKKA